VVTVTWNDTHGIADLSGSPFNPTDAAATWCYTLADTVAPQVNQLAPVAGAQVSRLTQLEVTFSEPVSGVNAADLEVNGQPATSVRGADAGPYLFTFPQPAAGTVQFAWVPDHGITDAAASPNRFTGVNWLVALSPGISPGDVVINEFLAANVTGILDEDGERQDWIELFNQGNNAVNLLGWSLTDDADVPGKWTFPSRVLHPGQFLVVFASGKDRRAPTGTNHFHTNFKLNPFGEYLALANPELPRVVVAQFAPEFPEQRNDCSYGRNFDGRWRYFSTPTPEAANGAGTLLGVAPPPHFSIGRGTFNTPFHLLLTTPISGATIRYTTDGSEPTATTGQVYAGPLEITNTTILRAATFQANYLPSRTRTHTYMFLESVLSQPGAPPGFPNHWGTNYGSQLFSPGSTVPGFIPADYAMDMDPVRVDPNNPASPIDPEKLQRLKDGLRELPIVSLVLNTDDMFGPRGLYLNSREGYPKTPNEKPCSVEMVLPDGATAFAVTCSVDLHGNASREPRKNPKHGFKLTFKGDYGETHLDYRLFPDSPAERFDDLILRPDFGTSWRHWSDVATESLGAFQRSRATRTRDAWFKNALRDMGHIASYNRYCHLFINGLYWGTYDFSEQPTESFAANYFGGNEADFDIYEAGPSVPELRSGTAAAYNAMVNVSSLSLNANYEAMKQSLDITEFIDYTLLHFFIGHQDWGYSKNWYAIRKRVPGPAGAFQYIPWDGENLLLDETINRVSNGTSGYRWPSDLQSKLGDNAQYRLDFADRVQRYLIAPDGALTRDANVRRWRRWQAVMDKPIVAESARWGDYRRDVHQYSNGPWVLYTRENQWLAEHDRMVSSYFVNRPAIVLIQLRAAGLYPALDAPEFRQRTTAGPVVGSQPVGAGFVVALRNPGGAGAMYFTTNGTDPRSYYSGAISGAAQPYATPLTLLATTTLKARVFNSGVWSALNEATFTIGELGLPLRITEIMYNPHAGDACEFLELQNTGAMPLDLGGFSFQGVTFVFPMGSVLESGAVLLLASDANPASFAARYPAALVTGCFGGSLANGGERIALIDRNGRTVIAVHYDDEAGWPAPADGGGYSLELIDANDDPNAPANWRASATTDGTPGLPPSTPAPSEVVINEIMADNVSAVANDGLFPDWLELHNRGTQPVDLANWSLTDNSEARQFVFPATILEPGGFLVVWCDNATNAPGIHTGFGLDKSGETVSLFNAAIGRVDAVSFGLQLADYTIGRVQDDWQLTVPTTNAANVAAVLASSTNLAINEWLANPDAGGRDWIELFNRSAIAPVALRGLFLTTSNAVCRLQSLSFIGPRGYARLFAEEQPGADQLEFKLLAAGGIIVLYDEAAVELERIAYGPQTTAVSEGRLPDGTATITAFAGSASPGSCNYLPAYAGPMLNEVLARNEHGVVSPW
jgi:hypothetical protein